MRFRAALGLVVAVAAVVTLAAPGFVAAQSPPDGTAANATSTTTIIIQPQPTGDARFSVETRFALTDANDTAAFRNLGEEFEAGQTPPDISTFRWAANGSSVATGRPMNLTNVSRNATIVETASANDTGRLALEFTWTNFAQSNDGRLMVGDAFNGSRGTWLPTLTGRQTLLIESPAGYGVSRSPTGAGFANGTVRFEGPASFSAGTPVVWFDRRSGQSPATDTSTPGDGAIGAISPLAVGGAVLLFGLVTVGAYVLREREGTGSSGGQGEATAAATTDRPDPPDPDEPTVVPGGDDELLSDEERVERLLVANDGRMKQASIVDATGWSNAKVSQLLSAMDEENRVNKLRIGRENLISLPDEE